MNQSAGDVKGEPGDDPDDEQNKRQYQKKKSHILLVFPALVLGADGHTETPSPLRALEPKSTTTALSGAALHFNTETPSVNPLTGLMILRAGATCQRHAQNTVHIRCCR